MSSVVFEAIRAWVHESPLSLCTAGSDTCDDWELSEALTDVVTQAGTPLERLAIERAAEISKRHADFLEKREEMAGRRR